MSLISKVGRNRGSSALLLGVFYALLLLGSVTMILPFLMTVTSSVTNVYDLPQYNIIPRFLVDRDALFVKSLFDKHADYDTIKALYRIHDADTVAELSEARDPLRTRFGPLAYDGWDPARLAVARRDWEDYWRQARAASPERFPPVVPLYRAATELAFQDWLRDRWLARWREQDPAAARTLAPKAAEAAALALLNGAYATTAGTAFHRIQLRGETAETGRLVAPALGPRTRDYQEFLATLPADRVTPRDGDGGWQQFLIERHTSLAKLNTAWGTRYAHPAEIRFDNRPPADPRQRADWVAYLTTRMPLAGVTIQDPSAAAAYPRWLLERYGSLEGVNRALKTRFASTNEWVFSDSLPADRRLRGSWAEFVADRVPVERWCFPHPLQGYHDFLRARYGTVAALAGAYGQTYGDFAEVRLPQAAFDRAEFLADPGRLRRHFLTDNFAKVFRFIALQGRALWNTVFLVLVYLAAALTLNPMTAYALSRFRIKNKQAILICFLLPMAFPGEVMQIPSFILIRDLGLLNTYAALILPGLVSGFSIFMLKGFFDGLPRELYEAADLDGASEWTIYWRITLPLSKPILALTTLGTVVAAYSEYMWAFIICPDQEKWTLAVWIFQFSMDAMERGQASLQMAALLLMSIPTLLIFMFTQKIIMKGIVLPTMK